MGLVGFDDFDDVGVRKPAESGFNFKRFADFFVLNREKFKSEIFFLISRVGHVNVVFGLVDEGSDGEFFERERTGGR